MQKSIKGISIAIIFLFIGVTLAPSINFNVVKAFAENEFVEVTSEACGIKGFGNNTMKLTKQQYQDLQQYLVDFRERLNKTTTREEAIPVFNEAVVELDKYGLLPKGMNIKQAQWLVTGGYLNEKVYKALEKYFQKNVKTSLIDNICCLVYGKTSNGIAVGPISTFISSIMFLIIFILMKLPIQGIIFLLAVLILNLNTLLSEIIWDLYTPISIGGTLCFGSLFIPRGGNPSYSSTDGFIWSSGLLGTQNF